MWCSEREAYHHIDNIQGHFFREKLLTTVCRLCDKRGSAAEIQSHVVLCRMQMGFENEVNEEEITIFSQLEDGELESSEDSYRDRSRPFGFPPKSSETASLNWNPHSIYIRSMNLQTHSPDTFAGGIIPSTTQNQKILLNTLKILSIHSQTHSGQSMILQTHSGKTMKPQTHSQTHSENNLRSQI